MDGKLRGQRRESLQDITPLRRSALLPCLHIFVRTARRLPHSNPIFESYIAILGTEPLNTKPDWWTYKHRQHVVERLQEGHVPHGHAGHDEDWPR